jgi:hypothetical protein
MAHFLPFHVKTLMKFSNVGGMEDDVHSDIVRAGQFPVPSQLVR